MSSMILVWCIHFAQNSSNANWFFPNEIQLQFLPFEIPLAMQCLFTDWVLCVSDRQGKCTVWANILHSDSYISGFSHSATGTRVRYFGLNRVSALPLCIAEGLSCKHSGHPQLHFHSCRFSSSSLFFCIQPRYLSSTLRPLYLLCIIQLQQVRIFSFIPKHLPLN